MNCLSRFQGQEPCGRAGTPETRIPLSERWGREEHSSARRPQQEGLSSRPTS